MSSLLLLALAAHADAPDNWKFSLDGYYRTRGYLFAHLYEGQAKPGTYMTHRLRLQPSLNFEDRAKFFFVLDGLDGVMWGDNQNLASTALFAGDPSYTGIDGQEVDPIQLERAWMEFKIPIGLFRVGRQGSNWGMGLLANEGNGFDDLYGENKYGATYDRFIFATRPLSVIAALSGMKDPNLPLIFAVGVDRLVEDPLYQYYGYDCDPDDPDDGCAPDEDHSFDDKERTDDMRSDTWWVDSADDVWEMIYVLTYRGENTPLPGGRIGDLIGGVYMVNRRQAETDSNVLIIDGYAKVEIEKLYFEGEVLHIGGQTSAITLPGAYDPSGQTENPLYKEADIMGYVVKGGYQSQGLSVVLEHGYASGDDEPADEAFTGRPLHPDYNVGMLLYEEIIARVTAAKWGETARGLWSNGGVYNSRYLQPYVIVRPMKNWEFLGSYLVAWPDKPDGSRILCSEDDVENKEIECAQYLATAKTLGWEADFAVKHRFHDHILFSTELGYAHATDRLPLESAGLNFEVDDEGHTYGNFFSVQTRFAYEF